MLWKSLSVIALAALTAGTPRLLARAQEKDAPETQGLARLAEGRIAVANRGSASISVIDTRTGTPQTIAMPAGERTPEPMYIVYSPVRHRVFVGDRANNRVVVFRAQDFSVETAVPVGNGVFHMWAAHPWRQLWVVNDLDRTVTVIDTWSLAVIARLAMPADLVALGGMPHDVILDPVAPAAWVSMLGFPGSEDYVIKYNTVSLREEARQRVGKDPHLSLSWRNRFLYVPCQRSNGVFVLNRRSLALRTRIDVPGAHGAGMTVSGRTFYTTNFASTGMNGLFAIDTRTNTVKSATHTPFAAPHNIAVTPDGRKIYVTHSGMNSQVSVYEVPGAAAAPRLLHTITVGQNPFGVEFLPDE